MFISTALAVAIMASPQHQSPEQRLKKRCDQTHVQACIKRAAIHYGQSYYDMRSTAFCESRFNPYAQNGPYRGLYQFDTQTWNGSPHSEHPRTSAKWASLATGWYWKRGERSRWPVCG